MEIYTTEWAFLFCAGIWLGLKLFPWPESNRPEKSGPHNISFGIGSIRQVDTVCFRLLFLCPLK